MEAHQQIATILEDIKGESNESFEKRYFELVKHNIEEFEKCLKIKLNEFDEKQRVYFRLKMAQNSIKILINMKYDKKLLNLSNNEELFLLARSLFFQDRIDDYEVEFEKDAS